MDIGLYNTYERTINAGDIDIAGGCGGLGADSGLYSAETGRLDMNAGSLSGDKQKKQCRTRRRNRKTTIRTRT
ncbi:hypothetical protein DSCA_31740 [Desulfosarcina alkanivorans]|uniref:Uncharacterized protein n=1 Tax=Desulfosarcina alkanivorans TaxID=571177 RepID=A0A5K7YSK7_9BACT|nr:hypothetical protein DSCA_31740 [Desulfosarcina alkanivorans]